MKKLYTLLAVLFTAVAANAQLYLCGTGTVKGTDVTLGWDPSAPYTVTASADGSYEFTLEGATDIKMSTTVGADWDAFNAGAVGVYEVKVGENDLITEGFDGLANTKFPWLGDWTVKVDIAKKTLTASTTTPEPSVIDLYLVGKIAGFTVEWGFADENKFNTTDGEIYTLDNVSLVSGNEFKIAGQGWSPNIGGSVNVLPNVVVTLEKSDNPANIKAPSFPYNGPVSFNLKTLEFVLGNFAGINDIEADNNAAPVYYNLQGVRVDKAENGLFIEVRGNKVAKVVK